MSPPVVIRLPLPLHFSPLSPPAGPGRFSRVSIFSNPVNLSDPWFISAAAAAKETDPKQCLERQQQQNAESKKVIT